MKFVRMSSMEMMLYCAFRSATNCRSCGLLVRSLDFRQSWISYLVYWSLNWMRNSSAKSAMSVSSMMM